MLRSFLGVSLIVWAGIVVLPGGEPPRAPPPRVIPIAELVQQLGSEDFAEREAATKRLSAIVIEPPHELIAATKSENPEVRQRALNVVQNMWWNVAATRLPRGQRFAERGEVDLFVAATAVWDLKADDPRLWEPALDLGRALLEKAEMTGRARPGVRLDPYVLRVPQGCPATLPDFATYKKLCNPRFTRVGDVYLRRPNPRRGETPLFPEAIQAPGVVDPVGLIYSVVIARGNVEVKNYSIQASLVVSNGNVSTGAHVSEAIIVCDGDVDVAEFITHSVVVARGNITAKQRADTSVLIAGGKVTVGGVLPRDKIHFNVIKENESNPFGYITFFELSTVGVEVKVADKAVRVTSVADEKPFADAGVRVGDIIAELNGKKPDSPDSLRRLLRDALAIGDATVKLQRGDKTETVKVSLPE